MGLRAGAVLETEESEVVEDDAVCGMSPVLMVGNGGVDLGTMGGAWEGVLLRMAAVASDGLSGSVLGSI